MDPSAARSRATERQPVLRVAVNTAILSRGISGTATTVSLITEALKENHAITLDLIAPLYELGDSRIGNAWAQAKWDLYGACRQASSSQVLISPCNIGRALPSQRHVLVIHDTMVLDHHERFDAGYALYARLLFAYSARSADTIMVPSEFTKRAILGRWPSVPEPVVIPWPVDLKEHAARANVRSHEVITVGATEPHKRHELAVEAVRLARFRSGADIHLRIIGPPGRNEAAVQSLAARHTWVIREGSLTPAGLDDAYANALCLLQPSLAEGYGLPVAEAGGWALPTIHSGEAALREIAPGAVPDGADPNGYAETITELICDQHFYTLASERSFNAATRLSRESFRDRLAVILDGDG
jgi:glycosyltransferase involved in cell wall biosynthesis